MIKLPQLVQQFYVAGIFLEQSSQREHTNFRPTGRDRGFFQGQVRLSIVRLIFQNFFDHFDRALRSPLNLTLRLHHRDRRSRNVEETFFASPLFRDFGSAQQLTSGQKLRLLFQDGKWMVEDRNSRNKTRLNGKNLSPYELQPLKDGDTLHFGRVEARFEMR